MIFVLQRFKRAIGWTITTILGIPSGICPHKIELDLNSIHSIEHQWRLNLLMQEVMKKKIIKMLDDEVFYPITNRKWFNPIQCIPKKGEITVVPNLKNELIPMTRLQNGEYPWTTKS